MLAVAKTSLTNVRIQGYISTAVLNVLRDEYGPKLKVVKEPDDDFEDWFSTDLAKKIAARQTPGKAIRIYRENFRWTQAQLGDKLGVRASFVSDLENDRRAVSKEMAKSLSKIFSISVGHFV